MKANPHISPAVHCGRRIAAPHRGAIRQGCRRLDHSSEERTASILQGPVGTLPLWFGAVPDGRPVDSENWFSGVAEAA